MRIELSALVVRALSIALSISLSGCVSVIGPSPVEGEWTVFESERFTLHSRPDSFAEKNAATFAEWLEVQYSATLRTLEIPGGGRVSGFLFGSADDAGRDFALSGTAYLETGAFKSVCVPPLDQNLFGLLAHEANHVILWTGLGRPGTTFVSEGLPSAVISEHLYPAGPTAAHAWVARNRSRVPPLADLVDDNRFSGYPQEVGYNTSASFLAYLIATYGPSPLKSVHGATSATFARRIQEAYRRPLSELESDWRRAVMP